MISALLFVLRIEQAFRGAAAAAPSSKAATLSEGFAAAQEPIIAGLALIGVVVVALGFVAARGGNGPQE